MRFEKFSFGSIRIDGTTYAHDLVIDRGDVRMPPGSVTIKNEAPRRFKFLVQYIAPRASGSC